ncbi:MAG: outer membrane beta-barrel family protein, partial [Alistipes sp.]|nr:outer membrane beta-barrel family protein [Alistipes sp.]
VNQQNFSFEDILGVSGNTGGGRPRGVGQYMVRPQSGVATVNSIGLNFSDTWGRNDNVTFQGSYFFNRTSTKNISTVDKWYEAPYDVDTLSTAGNSKTINSNHRLNARIEWKISPNQSLMSRTGFSYQANDPLSRTFGRQWGESGYSVIDNYSLGDRAGFNIREFLQYRAKLGKDGRTITVDGSFRYSDNRNTSDSYSNRAAAAEYDYLVPADTVGLNPVALLYQRSLAPKTEYELQGNFTYTEPLSRYAQFSMQYRASYENKESDKRVYTGLDGFDNLSGTPDPVLSNSYTSSYVKHRIGPGFRYSKERNTFIANVFYQRSTLDGQVDNGQSEKIRHNYNDFTYFMMGNLNINRENSLRLFVMSSTTSPEVTDLQGIYDVSDAQYISRGNPGLNPSYSHNVRFHYVNSNVNKGRTFMWMFTLQNTSDYVTTHTVLNPTMTIDNQEYRPLQYSQRINMDGYWSLRTHVSYGFPLNFMKCTLNLMTGVNYTVIPTMFGGEVRDGAIIGGQRNDADSFAYDASAVLGSNISENIDFTVSWNGSYTLASNSLAAKASKNRYFGHTASASLKATFLGGFTFTGSLAYTQNVGFTNDYNDEYMLCNLYLGHKLFKNKRGEIQVGVNDLLNQNRAFARTTGSGYTQNATNSVVGRYYTVQFVYNLRHFGKKGSKNLGDYGVREGETRGGFGGPGRPMGPPPMR